MVWHAGLGTIVASWDRMGGHLVATVVVSATARRRLPPRIRSRTYSSTLLCSTASLGSVDCVVTLPDAQGASPPGRSSDSTQAFTDLSALAAVRPLVFVAIHAPDFVTRGKRVTWNRYCHQLGALGYERRGAKLISAADLGGKADVRHLVSYFTSAPGLPVAWALPRAGPDAVAVRAAYDEPFVDTGANVRHPPGRRPPTVPLDYQRLPTRVGPRTRPLQIGFFGCDAAGSRVYNCEYPIPSPSNDCDDDFFASAQWSPGAVNAAWYLWPRTLSVAEELRTFGHDHNLLLPGPVAAVKALLRAELPTVTAVWACECMLSLLPGQSAAAPMPTGPSSEVAHAAVEPLLLPSPAGSCNRRDLAKLVGHLQFVAKAMPRNGYLRPMYDALNGAMHTSWDSTVRIGKHLLYGPGGKPRYDVDIPLCNVFWDALADINVVLAQSDGVYVMRAGSVIIHEGYGDASPSGAGLVDVDADGCISYRAGTWNVAEAAMSSNWKELRTVLSRLEEEVRTMRRTGASKYNGCVLYACTDNSTTAYAAESGTSTSRRLLELVRRIRLAEATLRCQVIVVWISGKRIIQSGADGASRGAVGEGLTGRGAAARLFNSPISHPGLFPSSHLLQALEQAFPDHQILLQPDEWVNRHFDRPVVIVACNLLVGTAIHQVKEVDRYTVGQTEAVVVAELSHAREWLRKRRCASQVVTLRRGQWGHPADAEGVVNLIVFQAGQPQTKQMVEVTADEFRPGFTPVLSGVCHTVLWPVVPERNNLLAGEDDIMHDGQTRSQMANNPNTCPTCPLGRFCPAARVLAEFPQSAATEIDKWAFLWTMRRAWKKALKLVPASEPELILDGEAALTHQYRRRHNSTPTAPLGAMLVWFKFDPPQWYEVGVGVKLPLRAEPDPFNIGNYKSSEVPEALEEATRVITAGYAEGEFAATDADNFKLGTPMGTVYKQDSNAPRNYLDAGATGLNFATALLNFLYDAHPEMFAALYPGCFYFKGDWSDAFLGVLVHKSYRKYFGFEHPKFMAERRAQFTPECLERFDQFVGRFQRGHVFTDRDLATLDAQGKQVFERMRQPVPKHHYTRLIFGWVLSPYFFTRLAQIVVDRTRRAPEFAGSLVFNAAHPNCPAMRHHRLLPVLYRVASDGSVAAQMYQYMDDGVGNAPSLYHSRRALRRMLAEIYSVGGVPKVSKTLPPTQHGGSILGFGADTRRGVRITIPPLRLAKVRQTIEDFTLLYGTQQTPLADREPGRL
jgi:hypothetical protein